MNVEKFITENNLKPSTLAELLGVHRRTVHQRTQSGWEIDYYIVDGCKRIGWRRPDGSLHFDEVQK